MPQLSDSYARISVAIVIEGVGDSKAASKGLAFYYGDPEPSLSDYQWSRSLLSIPSDPIEDAINPWTNEITASSFVFQLGANRIIRERLLHVQQRPDYAIGADAAASATSITIVDFDGAPVTTGVSGSVVFIKNEAIFLGTHAGSGVYTGSTRGYWSTSAEAHTSGEYVYTKNPYNRHRRVQLIRYDHVTGVATTKWRGFIEAPATNRENTEVILESVGLLAAARDAHLNRGAPQIPIRGFTYDAGAQQVYLYGQANYTPRLRKANATISTLPVQAGDTFTLATVAAPQILFEGPAQENLGAPGFEFDADDAEATGYGVSGEAWKTETYEVFYTDRNFQGSGSRRGGPSTADLAKPLNPVHIAMGFMTSDDSDTPSASDTEFNAFGKHAGLGLPLDLFNTSNIEDVVNERPAQEVARLGPLGWNGERIPVFQVTQEILLRAHGLYFGAAADGTISIARRRAASIEDYCIAKATPVEVLGFPDYRLEWRTAREGQFAQVTAELGGLPWNDPQEIVVESRDGQRNDSFRRGAFAADSELRLDMRTFERVANDAALPGRIVNEAAQGYYALPTIGVTAPPPEVSGADYGIGKWILLDATKIRTAWFIDPDGNAVTLELDNRAAIGQIIGRRYDVAGGDYELDLLLTNYTAEEIARWRAPVAQVDGNATTTTVTVYSDAFHSDGSDTDYFAVGDKIEAFDLDGQGIASTLAEITAKTATTLTLDTDISASLSGDELLRLANLDDYGIGGTHLAGCAERVFIFYADVGDQTSGSANERADVYA